jgi:hypothetical protein
VRRGRWREGGLGMGMGMEMEMEMCGLIPCYGSYMHGRSLGAESMRRSCLFALQYFAMSRSFGEE